MDQTLKAIVRMLEKGKPELKIAAAQVLGELGSRDPSVARALADRLTSGEEAFLTPFLVEALAAIGSTESVRVLVGKLTAGSPVGERVAHLLGQMGPEVTRALEPLFDAGDTEMQVRVLGILGRHSDREALTILRKALLHPEPALAEKAAEVIRGHLADLGEKQRDFLAQGLGRSLGAKAADGFRAESVAQALLVLGEIDGKGSHALLLRYAGPKNPAIVRQAALRALTGAELTAAQRRTLLGYVGEEDMTHVVRPAMRVLEGTTEWNAAATRALSELLQSNHEERRLFALRALKSAPTEKMARICIEILLQGTAEFQHAASDALGQNPAALQGLLRAFQLEKSADRARLLAEPLARLGKRFTAAQRKALVEKAAKLITGGDPLGDVYFALLLGIDRARGTSELIEKSVRLRRARRLPECLTILVRLAQTDHIDSEGMYQLAVARLMMDGNGARVGERKSAGDATMGFFSSLVRDGFPLADRLKKEGQLSPDDLFRVGRHFASGVAQERRFGGELLHHVADKHGRRKVGEEAKLTLRAEGL